MSRMNKTDSWNVGRSSAACAACAAPMPPGAGCWAALVEGATLPQAAEPTSTTAAAATQTAGPSLFARFDFCDTCWSAGKRPDPSRGQGELFSFWKTQVPVPTQKKKLFVDDSVLVDLFTRLEDKDSPEDVRFRFVLALILMRKRLLRYEGMEELKVSADEAANVPEVWNMLPRGENAKPVKVINPRLTPDQISEVSGQLSQILAEEV